MISRLAWDCHGSLGGCHPHGTAGHGGAFKGLGVLIFVVIVLAIGDHFGLWDN